MYRRRPDMSDELNATLKQVKRALSLSSYNFCTTSTPHFFFMHLNLVEREDYATNKKMEKDFN